MKKDIKKKKKNKKRKVENNNNNTNVALLLLAIFGFGLLFILTNYKFLKIAGEKIAADSNVLVSFGKRDTRLFAKYSNPNNRAIQNFAISNYNTDKEVIYFSSADASVYYKKNVSSLSSTQKSNLLLTKIEKTLRSGTTIKYKSSMYLKNSGHAQTLEVRTTEAGNDEIWTNGKGSVYLDSDGNFWGGSKGINVINYYANSKSSTPEYKYTVGVSNESVLHPDLGLDEENDYKKVALALGKEVTVFRKKYFLECASNDYDAKCYDVKDNGSNHGYMTRFNVNKTVNGTSYTIQGLDMFGNYVYIYLTSTSNKAGSNAYIKVYNLQGNQVGLVTIAGPGYTYEGEGIKIYDNKIFVGMKNKSNKNFEIYRIK